MRKLVLAALLAVVSHRSWAQQLVDVADLTLKLGGNEEKDLYYAFDANDQIVLSFEETSRKTLKSIAIVEEASNSVKFEDYEVSQINGKTLLVYKQGVYRFHFANAALLKGKVCKIKIQRQLLASGRADFNTSVRWVEKADTTYNVYTKKVVTGYREFDVQKTRRVLATVDTSVVSVVDRVERVHSRMNPEKPNYSLVNFSLPTNEAQPNFLFPYRTTEVISWAYSLGVGDSGQAWYKDANKRALAKSAVSLGVKAGLASTGAGAVAVLAIEGVSLFSNPPKGDNCLFSVQYSMKGQNYVLNTASGNSVTAFGRVNSLTQGSMTLRLENDNAIDAINVDLKIVACVVTKTYKDEAYTVKKREAIEEVKTFKEPKLAMKKVPIMMD